ncbi:MAG: roadblock/LC7 domain-containing protein [Burkholderiales bacterium]
MNPTVTAHAQRTANNLLEELDGARAVVIATSDGFDLAHAARVVIEPARLAAMVSSFAALGDAASRETGIGTPRCLVIESTQGRLVVRCIEMLGVSLVVVVLTDTSMLLGRVWNALASAEQKMVVA